VNELEISSADLASAFDNGGEPFGETLAVTVLTAHPVMGDCLGLRADRIGMLLLALDRLPYMLGDDELYLDMARTAAVELRADDVTLWFPGTVVVDDDAPGTGAR
jgi:hypothetical protein